MKLYHGSLNWVDKPEIHESDHTNWSISIYSTHHHHYNI